jgi:hypothetical protein
MIYLTGIRNITEQDEVDIGTVRTVVVHTHVDDGIESLEQITEAIDSGTENIKKQYMNIRDPENIIDNINDNVNEKVDEEQMMENCGMENLSAHNHLE